MAKATCTYKDCTKTATSVKMCLNHYKQVRRDQNRFTIICKRCKKTCAVPRAERIFCSRNCAAADAHVDPAKKRGVKSTPLTLAIRSGERQSILDEIRAACTETVGGCWEWNKGCRPDGYPTSQHRGKGFMVHRLALETHLGAPLGKQQAHHKCANPRCCNPLHLEPSSQRENIAEMQIRVSLEARISQLEDALRVVDPENITLRLSREAVAALA